VSTVDAGRLYLARRTTAVMAHVGNQCLDGPSHLRKSLLRVISHRVILLRRKHFHYGSQIFPAKGYDSIADFDLNTCIPKERTRLGTESRDTVWISPSFIINSRRSRFLVFRLGLERFSADESGH
jgi:hypothetical protein